MDFAQLNSEQLLAAFAATGFVVGCVLTRALGRGFKKNTRREDPRNHKIRELEADLRSSRRQMDDLQHDLDERTSEFNTSVSALQTLRVEVAERENELIQLKEDLKESIIKTRELRQELQDRATESVREHVRAEEVATELEVARAGSEAVMSEIARLQQERQDLSDVVEKMGDSLIPHEELFGEEG